MRAMLAAPAVAVAFLTIIPVPVRKDPPPNSFAHAVALFPLVGVGIGAAVATVDALLGSVLPVAVVAAIDLGLFAVLSGGLHLDGLADSADGLLGNLPRERRLAVMREAGAGAFAVVAVVLVILVEYGSLVSLSAAWRGAALVAAATASRWSMSVLLWACPYARTEGIGVAFRVGLGSAHALVATLSAVVVVVVAFSAGGLLLLLVAGGAAGLVGWCGVRRVGGCTGDVYGAGGELAFAATLVTLTALTR